MISALHARMMQPMSVHTPICVMAQSKNIWIALRASAQARAWQSTTHDRLMRGGKPMRSKHPNVQKSASEQVTVVHMPQSAGQLVQLSNRSISHRPFGHTAHEPQSTSQLAQSSSAAQRPSPQPTHRPQSGSHEKQLSRVMSHAPSPQVLHRPQSGSQEKQSSPLSI